MHYLFIDSNTKIEIIDLKENNVAINFTRNEEDLTTKNLVYFVQTQTLDGKNASVTKCTSDEEQIFCVIDNLKGSTNYSMVVIPCPPNSTNPSAECGGQSNKTNITTLPGGKSVFLCKVSKVC